MCAPVAQHPLWSGRQAHASICSTPIPPLPRGRVRHHIVTAAGCEWFMKKTGQGTQPDSVFTAVFASAAQKWPGKQSLHTHTHTHTSTRDSKRCFFKKVNVALLPFSSFSMCRSQAKHLNRNKHAEINQPFHPSSQVPRQYLRKPVSTSLKWGGPFVPQLAVT